MSCGVCRRHGSDPVLRWLWCRLAATAPIQPLAWELPYTAGVALKSKKKSLNKIFCQTPSRERLENGWIFLLIVLCLIWRDNHSEAISKKSLLTNASFSDAVLWGHMDAAPTGYQSQDISHAVATKVEVPDVCTSSFQADIRDLVYHWRKWEHVYWLFQAWGASQFTSRCVIIRSWILR